MATTYGIAELAREFGVTARAIRFYEDRGFLRPARRGLARIYSESDRRRLRLLLRGKRLGFSLDEIREMLDLHYAGPDDMGTPGYLLNRIAEHRHTLRQRREDAGLALEWLDHLETRCHRLAAMGRKGVA
jgi:DNA-binding transcriptional MerR regulator